MQGKDTCHKEVERFGHEGREEMQEERGRKGEENQRIEEEGRKRKVLFEPRALQPLIHL